MVRVRGILPIIVVGGVASALLVGPATAAPPPSPSRQTSVSSSPPDRTIFRGHAGRAATRLRPFAAGVSVIDATASAGSTGGGEPSIAVNPADPDEIAITRFNADWNGNADLLFSTDGGATWTNETSIPPPPGIDGTQGCPCDQTIDYGRDGTLYGTFLAVVPNGGPHAVITGSTQDPTSASAWNWNGDPAQRTSGDHTFVDQPWLLVNRDTDTASQDDVYVAYDNDIDNPDATPTARVAASYGANPVDITNDSQAGNENPLATNPGLRLANDPRGGTMYAVYEQSSGTSQPKHVTYKLNRSTDGGRTWTLNGDADGLTVDTVDSDQAPGFKFGGVNALLGGVDHAAVDPTNGDVYVAYGQDVSGGNRIRIRRLTANGGGLDIGPAIDVSASTNAALPSVAITSDGTLGVLYDTFDGNTADGFPTFTAHLARSTDHGATFEDTVLQTFQSPAMSNNDDRQRVLGDYHQLKAVGDTFYGTFAGNTSGVPADSPPIDAMFFKAEPPPPPAATLTYTGPTTSDFHDAFTASATLTVGGGPIAGASVEFSLGAGTGAETCTATTNGSGVAACSITPEEAAGTATLTVSFAGNDSAGPVTIQVPFTITKEETTTAYTGPARIANATPVRLTGVLKEDGTVPITGRTLTFALGSGATLQTCSGTTDASGVAACSITPDQPLNAAATVPLAVTFAGDDFYRPSAASATLLLQFMTGRAFGLSAAVNLPLIPLNQPPTPDTGPVRTAGALTTNTPCTATLNLVILSGAALCPKVTTTVNPGTSTATTTVKNATIGIPGVPVIKVTGLSATSMARCVGASGRTAAATLTIGGAAITIPTAPNSRIPIPGVGQLTINEQVPVAGADAGLTVNALHLTALGNTVNITIASATADAHNCA